MGFETQGGKVISPATPSDTPTATVMPPSSRRGGPSTPPSIPSIPSSPPESAIRGSPPTVGYRQPPGLHRPTSRGWNPEMRPTRENDDGVMEMGEAEPAAPMTRQERVLVAAAKVVISDEDISDVEDA